MSGRLYIVGLGPGSPEQMTPQALDALAKSAALYGYGPYLDRVPARAGQERHPSDNRVELERSKAALDHAATGATVSMVTGGDPGVFAMAAAVCEAIEHGPDIWKTLEIEIVPGVTAMLAVAARVGAPLGHDFCAISLSDNLKPWDLIETRLALAARAGFVIALYNPISKARPWQLGRAFEILRGHLDGQTPVILGRAAGRPDEKISLMALDNADPAEADMATCVIIGSGATRRVERPGKPPLIYTPRSASPRS